MVRHGLPGGARAAFHTMLATLAALGLIIIVSGCSEGPPPCPPCPEPEPCPEIRSCPEPPQPLKGRLRAIAKRGTFRCGVRDSVIPFGFTDEHSGLIIGFEVDICRAIARSLDARLVLVPVTASTRIPMLLRGEIDCIAATMTHHHARERDLDFSITYFMDGQKLLTRSGSSIRSATDLVARKVGVVSDSWAKEAIAEAQPEGRIMEFPGYAESFLSLKRGTIDAMTADSTILLGLKNSDDDPAAWTITGDYITDEPYAMGLPEDDSDFRDHINRTLQELWLSGEYMKIYNRWFGPHTKYYLPTSWKMEIWPGAPGRQ